MIDVRESTDKLKILIVDDSELNRELLAGMLEDEYEIYQVENGKKAIDILEENREQFKLVLLDINMPVMDGYEVLSIMKRRKWLDKLPVIVISAEISGESVKKAYELGASDYFVRPFNVAIVLRRVRNTITLYDNISSNLKDAVTMLSTIFYRILKIDLEADSYEIIEQGNNDPLRELYQKESISACLKDVAEKGYIHEEDYKEYTEFCSLEHLKKIFLDGSQYASLQYRRVLEGQYRWVSMEIVRSTEYREDNQQVVMYIRDINDDYLKLLQIAMCHTLDSVGIVSANISQGICLSFAGRRDELECQSEESIDTYIQRVSEMIPMPESREHFCQVFSQQNMLKLFTEGTAALSMEAAFSYSEEQQPCVLRINVDMACNSFSREIEGVLHFTDVTVAYLIENVPQKIYQKDYENIIIIDAKREKMIKTDVLSSVISDYLKKEEAYEGYRSYSSHRAVVESERERFKKCVELSTIKEGLRKDKQYFFTIHETDKTGEVRLKRYSYIYIDERVDIIVGAREDITEFSEKDVLTGGYNRRGFIRITERLLNEVPDRTKYAVLFFNVKNFKAVNELFGVESGDVVLQNIFRTLTYSKLSPVITARVESDHFVCLVENKNLDFEELTSVCDNKFVKDGKCMNLIIRCGIFYVEEKPMKISGMIDRAKLAKRYITDEYVQPYMVYDHSMQVAYIDKAKLAGELQEGIAKEQFKVYYQPVIDTKTGKIASAEALIRWIHPDKGFISPALFIPALEENGHISELDFYVLKKVWQFINDRCENNKFVVPISVNLSWMDFYDEIMMEKILKEMDCFRENGREHMARFEITETSYAAIRENRSGILESLRIKNAKILLDDFGSGFSSFGMLQDYDFDILKIDMSFIRKIGENPKTKSIVHSIIGMAHEIGIKTVAEGVETEEQVSFLRQSGCDYIQGYYYSKPLPEEEFVEFLEKADAE
ncbi:EAL domain-containing protein [Anaerobutyricum hallii]|jgi:diguanylate cyclase (GGDEF)-like protein|uniref:Stage 0 sporulation protein A homolog n=1 Tax=Anaerobutyricum hallii TaxID=39488 RepID=A0A414B2U4_9FIRM|nr:EAL domain-containing protein [Anaerobutyricum hallii]RHC61351.1 EAL domain-containing protein [Anaerobutyricum hallii]